jgi:hypothetical protein
MVLWRMSCEGLVPAKEEVEVEGRWKGSRSSEVEVMPVGSQAGGRLQAGLHNCRADLLILAINLSSRF